MTRRLAAIVVAIGVIGVLAGPAVAGHLATNVASYTGCLVSKDGVIIRIKPGDAPSSPCSGGMAQVHFAGGDITKISVTGALTGGGDNGAVTIGLKPEFTLPAGCVAGRVAEWNGSAWVCGVDDDTTYSQGTGLDLTGTTFSIDEDYRVKNTPDCPAGQFATGFTSAGTIICAAPSPVLPEAWFMSTGGDAPEGHDNEITSRILLKGNYVVNVAGWAYDDPGGDDEVDVTCGLYAGATAITQISASDEVGDIGLQARATLAMTAAVELAATTEVSVSCRSFTGSDSVKISVTILQVGTVN